MWMCCLGSRYLGGDAAADADAEFTMQKRNVGGILPRVEIPFYGWSCACMNRGDLCVCEWRGWPTMS
jgi:hypothetical protein